jgi:DNA topoisomerase I
MVKGKSLIIVESPAKIKTLKKFVGKTFVFASSMGHVRDLPEKGFGIDLEHDFEPQYEALPDKKEVIAALRAAAKECDVVYLSPDPDREGEAIAWHIAALLPAKTVIKRTAFNSITKDAVLEALAHPQEINIALVNAQQARRLLDRIVGYKISPILARRIQRRGSVSAGRVQSVALKLVVDREKEIEAFKPVEYWNIGALLQNGEPSKKFLARLYAVDGRRWEKEALDNSGAFLIPNQKIAAGVVEKLEKARYRVAKVDKREKKRNPEPPFITSTLQQEASRHHRFSASKAMSIAQTLYEGIDLDSEGTEGLITYMRTDSVRIVPEALAEARNYIQNNFGSAYLPDSPRTYITKKAAQDAHEAIRPTNLRHTPERVKKYLTREQHALYDLIWKRFIASQMNPAIYDTVSADIETDQNIIMRATGSTIKFKGFLALYEEKVDEEKESEEEPTLPPLAPGMPLHLVKVTSEQAFTKPPPRFTEASLVKELEKSGIGRPSTYASIMNKIQSRDYTTKENLRLKPTELGCVIAQFLETNFKQIMNVGFTAEMEDTLELVADNKKEWKQVIRDFWQQFLPTIDIAEKEAFVPKVMTDLDCPKCKEGKLQKIWSKSRYFYGCSRYPDCDYTTSNEELNFNKSDYADNFDWDQTCPQCGNPMKLRHGRFGPFLGCTNYPTCKGIVNIPKKGEASVSTENAPPCPAIGCDGKIVARKSRFGKTFYSCTNYPSCDVIVNDLGQLDEKYINHPKTPYEKKGKKKTTKKGFKKRGELTPSTPLATVIGTEHVTRGEATKKLWDYIKTNNLQDPKDKRNIIPDALLAKVFGSSEPINMFKLASILNQHLST